MSQTPMIENGVFEAFSDVTPDVNGLYNNWKLIGPQKVPNNWTLNPAYPGTLSILSEEAHSGNYCIQIQSSKGKEAHIYQPCPGMEVGKYYRIRAWIRGGGASLLFYEYRTEDRITISTICVAGAMEAVWGEIVGLYAPRGDDFRYASFTIVVGNGQITDIDDVIVEESNAQPIVLENDAYVTPRPDDRLLSVECPSLEEPITEAATVLTLSGQPDRFLPNTSDASRIDTFPGNWLQVEDEIIRFYSVNFGPSFQFIDCKRAQAGTKATTHPKGAPVKGLLNLWGFFLADPDTTILSEMTQNFADLFNYCDFDMVYFDASDFLDEIYPYWYYLNNWHLAFYRKFKKNVLYQYSMGWGTHLCWHIIPRSASADGKGDIKNYLNCRYNEILKMADDFLRTDIGWYKIHQVDPGQIEFSRPLWVNPEQIEYVCAKALGCDASISIQCYIEDPIVSLERNPRAREIFEIISRWEQCRLEDIFPEMVKAELREPCKDFKLLQPSKGQWMLMRAKYEQPIKIFAFDGESNIWTVMSDRKCLAAIAIYFDNYKPNTNLERLPRLKNPQLKVNNQLMRFSVQLECDECLTTDGIGGCTIWQTGMKKKNASGDSYKFELFPGLEQFRITVRYFWGYPEKCYSSSYATLASISYK